MAGKLVTRIVADGVVRDAAGTHLPGEECRVSEREAVELEKRGILTKPVEKQPGADKQSSDSAEK